MKKRLSKWLAISTAVSLLLLLLIYVFLPRPEIKHYTSYSSAYFDQNNKLLRLSLADDDRYRLYQPLAAIAPSMVKATILYEDQHYYQHSGIDTLALFRAAWDTYVKRTRRVGASTITMQVARLRWNISSNNLSGKLAQIGRAIQLNRHYSKDQIIELYLNLAPYGRNIEGVAAASLVYFNKKPSELTLSEALTLAVIPQNPNKRNPTSQKNINELVNARNRLYQRWLEHAPQDKSKSTHFELAISTGTPETLPFHTPHFINYINGKRSRWSHGYISTSLDLNKQRTVEKLLKNYVRKNASIGIHNASALLLNYQTMSIEAMVGSADFHSTSIQGQVNAATAKRSPGSTLKPFVYALALDEGLIHPLTLLKDSPRRYGGFTPENYDKQFLGPISAKDALIQSRNVPAVDLQAQLTKTSFYDFLKTAGITKLKGPEHYGLALALGGGEVSMLELATLYAAIANKGILKPIQYLKKPADSSQKIQRILSTESSFMTLDMLKDNPPPKHLNARTSEIQRNDIAWKTGTSWAFRDAWSVGVSGPYVLVVWVGNFDSTSNDAFVGRRAAAPLFFSILNAVNEKTAWRINDLIPQAQRKVKQIEVCAETGDLYEKHCQSSALTWFIPGVSPIKTSNIYRSIPIDIKSGLRACFHHHGHTQMEVYQFWPSDFLAIFDKAGIALKTPPKFKPGCSLASKRDSGQAPIITSPQSTIEYAIKTSDDRDRQIAFNAIVDTDVSKLHWFIGNRYIGSVKKGKTLFWKASPGRYPVAVVDDSGRSAEHTIIVKQIN